jgi:ribosome-associated protein
MNSENLCKLVIDALDDVKAKDIVTLDVRRMTSVTDYMVVASGTSNRHVKALADAVADKAREAGNRPVGVEGEEMRPVAEIPTRAGARSSRDVLATGA